MFLLLRIIFIFSFFCFELKLESRSFPTTAFLEEHSKEVVDSVLKNYGMNSLDAQLFHLLVEGENENFIGYHAGCSDYRIFQDIIRCVMEEKLGISIPEDFHFLRVPCDDKLVYSSAAFFIEDFVSRFSIFADSKPEIRQHILSLNTCLYRSYRAPWDLTPRYYLENRPWTQPDFWMYLKDFFEEVGLKGEAVERLVDLSKKWLPSDRGFILQFFDESENHSFLDTHFYAAHSGGMPHKQWSPSYLLMHPLINLQLRLVIDNQHVLNPFRSPLKMRRLDNLSLEESSIYHLKMKEYIQELSVEEEKKEEFLRKLFYLWYEKAA